MTSPSLTNPLDQSAKSDWLARHLDLVGVILVALNPDGTITYINQRAVKLLGCEHLDVPGSNWFDLFVPEREREQRRAHFGRWMRGESSPSEWLESTVVTCPGEERIISWHRSVLKDAEERITGMFSSGEDITDRRLAEQELARERNLLRTLIDNVPDYIFAKDRDSRFLLNNVTHARVMGFEEPREALGHSDFGHFPPELARQYREDELLVMETGQPLRKEELVVAADGSHHWLLVIKAPLRMPTGEIAGIVGVGREITDRKLAEEALAWTADSNAAMAELSRTLLSEMTAEQISAQVLETARRLTGSPCGYVGYVDLDTGHFRTSATVGMTPAAADGEDGNDGRVFRDGSEGRSPLLINSVVDYSPSVQETAGQKGIRNLLAVPAIAGDRLVGRIVLANSPGGYTQGHLSLIQRMATLYAIVLERERAGRELLKALDDARCGQAEIEALLQAARAVLLRERFEDVAPVIFDGLSRLVGAHAGFVSLLTEDGNQQRTVCKRLPGSKCRLNVDSPVERSRLFRQASDSGRTTYCNEISPGRLPKGHVPIQNALYAPIFLEGQVVGLLALGDKPGGFDDEDAMTTSTFAELASLALHHFSTMQSLEQSEERFRLVAQSASDAIISVNSKGLVVFWNRQAERLFGYTADEAMGRSLSFILPRSMPVDHEAAMLSMVAEGHGLSKAHPIEVMGLHKDGQELPLELSLASWKTGEGQFFTGIVRNITERKQAEARQRAERQAAEVRAIVARILQEQRPLKERFRDVLRHLTQVEDLQAKEDGVVFLLDGSTNRLEPFAAGDAWSLNAGCGAETLDRGECLCGLAVQTSEIVVCGDCTTDERHSRHDTAMQPHGDYAVPLTYAGQPIGVLCVPTPPGAATHDPSRLMLLRQIGDLMGLAIANARVQDELRRARQVAEEVSRSKSAFLASMSHELRTPLNTVLGVSEALTEGVYGALNEKQGRSVRAIGESGSHLLELINELLDLSKIEAGQFELEPARHAIADVCASSLQLVRQLAMKKRLKVSSTIDATAESVVADQRRLKQILVNLLGNAIKFTPEGGTVGLEVSAQPDLKEVHFTIWDTGIGIAAEDMPRLFQPFVQLDSTLSRRFAGTGLGLSLVRRMVELHGGRVWVESQVAQGSRFTVALPWDPAEETERDSDDLIVRDAAPPQHVASSSGSESPLILLVEDNEYNIATLSDYLTAKGYRLEVARDGLEAVQLSKELQPSLILMDVQMPRLDGLEATRRIRQEARLADVPIIALTSAAMPGDRERCLEAGVNYYLSKPVSLRELIRSVEEYLKAK